VKKSIEKDEMDSTNCITRLKKRKLLSLYSNKKSTIASGATPIGSTGHTPDKIASFGSYARVKIDFIIGGKHQIINSPFTPIGSDLQLVE
jgi:hypothetical protein